MSKILNAEAVKINYWKVIGRVLLLQGCGLSRPVVHPVSEVSETHLYTPYTYSATVIDVYDRDTFTLEFDLGFGLTFEDVIRLTRVDTPELLESERQEGIKVRDYIIDLILDKRVIAKTDEDDRGKYGRVIAEIYYFRFQLSVLGNPKRSITE